MWEHLKLQQADHGHSPCELWEPGTVRMKQVHLTVPVMLGGKKTRILREREKIIHKKGRHGNIGR